MKHSRLVAAATMAVLAGSAFQPVAAQYGGQYPGPDRPNGGAYDTQRNGNNDGRADRGFNDRAGANDRNDYRQGGNGRDADRSQAWQRRYARVYNYNDDTYYQQCSKSPDPAGVIAGALIGGLLGNAATRGNARPGATAAGIILGGALGAGLTRNLNCEDRSYTYKAYYQGFNAGRPNQDYAWRNPKDNRHGVVRIGNYYNDPDGFRCTTFTQTIYIGARPQVARGRACQQPNGSWTIVG